MPSSPQEQTQSNEAASAADSAKGKRVRKVTEASEMAAKVVAKMNVSETSRGGGSAFQGIQSYVQHPYPSSDSDLVLSAAFHNVSFYSHTHTHTHTHTCGIFRQIGCVCRSVPQVFYSIRHTSKTL